MKGGGVEEDIQTVSKDPWALEIVENKHNEDVINHAVYNNGMVLQIVSEKYITKDIVFNAIKNNGLALEYVPVKFITKELCLLALMDKTTVLYYIPDELIDNDIIDIILSYNEHLLMDPEIQQKLSHANIEYIKRNKPDFELLDLSPPDVLPPELEKNYSDTYIKQGAKNCGATSFSRVILKNIFETLYPIKSNTKQCNQYFNTGITSFKDIENLTPTNCSLNGYLKILLYLHIFNLYKRLTEIGTKSGVTYCMDLTAIYGYLYNTLLNELITEQQSIDTNTVLQKIKEIKYKYNVLLVTFSFKDITLSTIKKITDNGLYLTLGITSIDETLATTEELMAIKAHYLTIVGTYEDYILIKNQWGPDVIYKHKLGTNLVLSGYTWKKLTHCIFVLPFIGKGSDTTMQYDDLRHLDAYLVKYQELKRVIQEETKQGRLCPSRDKTPVECIDRKHYLQQSSIFHPDRNLGCKKESIEKFTKLQTLRGCTKDGGKRKYSMKRKSKKT